VTLTPYVARGVLEGRPVAAVIIVTATGGSGSFYDLALLRAEGGEPTNVATVLLGDRVQAQGLAVREGEIVVDLVRHGPHDPLCCPSQQVLERYALERGELVRIGVSAGPGR
jgi:hypothetical protein